MDFRNDRTRYLEHHFDQVRIRVYGPAAVVVAREAARLRDAAGEHWVRWHIMDVFVRQHEEWRVVATHESTLPGS